MSTAPVSGKRLLLLDDDPASMLYLRAWFERQGIKPLQAHSVAEAKQCLLDHPVGFAITDLRMPGEDGLDFLLWCKTHHPDLPVVVYSASSVDATSSIGSIPDVLAHFTKPIRRQQLEDLTGWVRDALADA